MTHYDTLGVPPDAGPADIRAAYLQAARRHHPDRVMTAGPGERQTAERRMRDINEAWRVLGDPERRRAYDRELGHGGPAPGAGFRPFDTTEAPDPRDMPDVPYRQAAVTPGDRFVTIAPVALFALAIGTFVVGLVVGSAGVVAVAGVTFVLACVAVAALALLTLARAARDE